MASNSASINIARPPKLGATGILESIAGLAVNEYGGIGIHRFSEFVFTNMALAIAEADGANVGSVLLYTFPKGWIMPIAVCSYLAFTTTSIIANTLNDAKTVQYGFGTVAATANPLATTNIDFLAGTGQTVPTFASSATINVAGTAVTHASLAAPIPLDGSSTPIPLYFNLNVPTDNDIDDPATLTVSGTLNIEWSNLGGWDYNA